LLKSNDFNGLSSSLIRRFANQIAQALKLLSRYQIIHCDLKPENILLKQPSRSCIKIIDFGSSCMVDKRVYTYIQSRFYRAPEIILGIPYTTAIDMWSFGCILVELHTGYPLFPGESEAEQILCIMEVIGLPPKSLIKIATRASKFFDQDGTPKSYVNSRGKKRVPCSKSLEIIMKGADAGLVDVVKKCLTWEFDRRVTPEDILTHEWMKENKLSVTKKFSRGGSAQPHQGTSHSYKLSFEEAQLSIRNSFLAAGSCKSKKIPTFIF
jgi:dual specificity tyrosine-phosphorylation-regulated kinase 2/3/4